MKIDYTRKFATTKQSTIMVCETAKEAVLDISITKQDYVNDPRNRFAEEYKGKRHEYSDTELDSRWKCVKCAREKMMAWYLVETGAAIALNPALEMVRA